MDAYRLDPYLNIRTARNPVYAHTGPKLRFITNYKGINQIWELGQGERIPTQRTTIKKGDITSIAHVSGTEDLIIGIDQGGKEKQQLFLLKQNDELIPLTNSPEHIHIYGGSSPDGKWISWSSNRRSPANMDIYIQNLETLDIHFVYGHEGVFQSLHWSPVGNSLLVEKRESPLYNELGIFDLSAGVMNWLTDLTGDSAYDDVYFNKSGEYLYLLSNKGREFMGLALMEIQTKKFYWLEKREWDFENLAVNQEKDRLAFRLMKEEGLSLSFWISIKVSFIRGKPH